MSNRSKIKQIPDQKKSIPRRRNTALLVKDSLANIAANKQKPQKHIKTPKRLYVIDTNVFMHDPTCIFRFQEHDILIPFQVLEELDNHKKGHEEKNRNVREVCRKLESIFSENNTDASKGIPLGLISGNMATGSIFLQAESMDTSPEKADNRILEVVKRLSADNKECQVVLVSKDINMRLKARALGLSVEDYHNDMVTEDTEKLFSGFTVLPDDFWPDNSESWKEGAQTHYKFSGSVAKNLMSNEFVSVENGKLNTRVTRKEGQSVVLSTIHDYMNKKNETWGICARNKEQSYALNLLMDPNIDLVTLSGKAGSGKTLLTLAAGLSLTLDSNLYSEIIFTRVTIPVGDEDIGFLPGTEEEKMTPWLGALYDNLDVLNRTDEHNKKDGSITKVWAHGATMELIHSRLKIRSLGFMRGRTFLNKFLIVDEVQNLTPKQVKMLITRAGPGTKVVCLGNLSQIDTPYLTEGSSGLSYLIDRFKGWKNYGHVTLQAGERSRLASRANDVL